MKQLKFFTSQSDTMQATKAALSSLGIAPHHLRVFTRANQQHRFDGLVMQSDREKEESSLNRTAAIYAGVSLLGAFAVYSHWFAFIDFFAIVFVVSLLFFLRNLFFRNATLPEEANEKVYFLVVEVEEENEKKVASLTEACPGLIAQM